MNSLISPFSFVFVMDGGFLNLRCSRLANISKNNSVQIILHLKYYEKVIVSNVVSLIIIIFDLKN